LTQALEPQSTLQAPQLRGSKVSVVHRPPHAVCPLAQLGAQAPLAHTWPAGQAAPHAPQLALSFAVLTSQPSIVWVLQLR
jgi:hypothetical protein